MTSQSGTLDAKPSRPSQPRDAAHAVQIAGAANWDTVQVALSVGTRPGGGDRL
jgi:hypothetical protein